MAAPGLLGVRKTVALTLAAAGTQVIEAAAANKIIEVDAYNVASTAATALPQFEGSSGTVVAGPVLQTAGVSELSGVHINTPLFWTAIGEGLTFRTSGAGVVSGFITYRIVPV